MKKEISQTLLKIYKADDPLIYEFLENVPRGTKTAHIREALTRYIHEINNENGTKIPSKKNFSKNLVKDRKNSKMDDVSVNDYQYVEDNSNSKLSSTLKKEEKEELVELDINLI